MIEILEMKINKNTEIVFDFYYDKILPLVNIKNKNVILIGLGNTKFIKFIKSVAKNVCIIDHCLPFERDYKLTDVYQLEIDIEKYLEKNNMPKFDVAVMNPPYGGTLHIDCMEKVLPHCKKMIDISPNIFLKFRLPEKCWSKSKFMNDRLENVEILPYETNFIFNIGNSIPGLCIYTFNEVGKLNIENVMFKNKIEKSLFTKIFKKRADKLGWENKNTKRHGEQSGYFVNLYTWHSDKDAYSTCIREDDNSARTVYFSNDKQRKNFKNSFKTKFMNFYCKEIILKGNGITDKCFMFERELYNSPWTDKRFCEYFGITGYIDDDHAEPNSEWEIILNTMKEHK